MLRPEQLIRVVIELIFVLLGLLVGWLGLTNQIFADPRKATWMILAVALIVWGAYAFARPSPGWLTSRHYAEPMAPLPGRGGGGYG